MAEAKGFDLERFSFSCHKPFAICSWLLRWHRPCWVPLWRHL